MKKNLRSILSVSIFVMGIAFLLLYTKTASATYNQCNWGNWYDTSDCIANGCGTCQGSKTQQKDCTKEVCDKACPSFTYSTEKKECPSHDWAYTSTNSHKDCKRKVDVPGDGTSNKVWRYADEVVVDSFGPVAFTYNKSQDPNKCHRPTGSSLGVPGWAMSNYNHKYDEWKYVINVNCHEEVIESTTRTKNCSDAAVIECESTITPTPAPIDEITPTPIDEDVTPTPTTEATPTATPDPLSDTSSVGGPKYECTDSVPATPTILSAKYTSSVTVTWSKVSNANDYSILYGTTSNEYPYSVFKTGNTDNYTINGIDSGCFRVKAINGCMPGELSPEVCTGGTAGQVLGASTLGSAGSFEDNIYNLMILGGVILTSIGIKKSLLSN